MRLIHSGCVAGGMGSPPCSTVSAARHVPLQDSKGAPPRPLRSRTNPWYPLSYCTDSERLAVQVGSVLFLLVAGLLGEIAMKGGWVVLEHPADRGREPYPSFFCTEELKDFCQRFKLQYRIIHQCRYGAVSKKPTGLIMPPGGRKLQLHCNHTRRHKMLIGLDSCGKFRTTPAAKYPPKLCEVLAEVFFDRWLAVRDHSYSRPCSPQVSCEQFESPWNGRQCIAWPWPQPSPNFLAQLIETINCRKVHPSFAKPQQ